jgi:hypothetical protein
MKKLGTIQNHEVVAAVDLIHGKTVAHDSILITKHCFVCRGREGGARVEPVIHVKRRHASWLKKRQRPIEGLGGYSPVEGLDGDGDSFSRKRTRRGNISPVRPMATSFMVKKRTEDE